jgi:hypothetical protein
LFAFPDAARRERQQPGQCFPLAIGQGPQAFVRGKKASPEFGSDVQRPAPRAGEGEQRPRDVRCADGVMDDVEVEHGDDLVAREEQIAPISTRFTGVLPCSIGSVA